MVRIRRLQSNDEKGRWHAEAYVIETPDGQLEFRYPLSWEYLGAQYNAEIRKRGVTLERLEEILQGKKMRWQSPEVLQMSFEQSVNVLDRECHIPTREKAIVAQAA